MTNSRLIAVKGRAAAKSRGRSGLRNHLSHDGQRTLCGLVVMARIHHVTPDVRLIVDCQSCWRSSKSL